MHEPHGLDHPRQPPDGVDDLFDASGNEAKAAVSRLQEAGFRTYFERSAKCWLDGELWLHVHARTRRVIEDDAQDWCWVFMRERQSGKAQATRAIEIEQFHDLFPIRKVHPHMQGVVLVDVGELPEHFEIIDHRVRALVGLRLLQDCPRVSVDLYPVQGALIWRLLSGLDVIDELIFGLSEGELINAAWFMSIPVDKLPDEVVQSRPEILQRIAKDERPPLGHLRDWWSDDREAVLFVPYLEREEQGVRIFPGDLIIQNVQMLIGPPELGSDDREISKAARHGR